MTADERLAGIRAKIKRANKHIEELDAACRSFSDPQEKQVRFRTNLNTGDRTYYVEVVQDVPVEIALLAGDAAHNLRVALDHLAYQLVDANGGNELTRRQCFPICGSPAEYTNRRAKATQGMSQKAIARIDEANPFKGGNDVLWRLHQLDIIDKHRLLLMSCLVNTSHSMTPSQRAGVNKTLSGGFCIPSGLLIASPKRSIPLKAGYGLLTVSQSDAGEPTQFGFVVAFDEKIFDEPVPVISALTPMANLVEMIIENFAPLLA